MGTSPELVLVDARGEVTHLVMDRPPANALGRPLLAALEAALDRFEEGASKALVISSARPGFFAAGADLKYIATLDKPGFEEYRDALRSPIERIAACGRPSIAAIDGLALGGGLELAMACTLRLATQDSQLGLPEVRLGLIPGAGGTQRLPRLVGAGRALEIMLTGRQLDAREAAAIGLVNEVCEGDVVELALERAAGLGQWPAAAIDAIITCVEAALVTPERGMDVEGYAVARLFADGDASAGIAAFLQRTRAAAEARSG
jgi:enoyl-CoA hydratase/carnithine racemase